MTEVTVELKKYLIEEQAAVMVECLNNTHGETALFFYKLNEYGSYSVSFTANMSKLHGKSEQLLWLAFMNGIRAAMNLLGTKKYIEIYSEHKAGLAHG